MKNNQNMPPVHVPVRHPGPHLHIQRPALPGVNPNQPTTPGVGGDPYARPAGEVTVNEWRVMIAAVAGPLRISQGASREIAIPAGQVKLLAQNDKSYALFVFGQALALPQAFVIGGDPRATNPDSGIRVLNIFEQILLPKEKLYGFSTGGVSIVITEVTV